MGRSVSWRVQVEPRGSVRMEALVEGLFPDRRFKVHVWIEAPDRGTAQSLSQGLASLRLVP